MTEAEFVFAWLDRLLGEDAEVDYPGAWNGVQVERQGPVRRIGAAVDASERVIRKALDQGVDLLLVHHGLFWEEERRLTGRRYRKARLLLDNDLGVYASHLPLDRHPQVGNSALLLRSLGLEPDRAFGSWKGLSVGWSAPAGGTAEELLGEVQGALGGNPRLLGGGPARLERVAVVTGAGAAFLPLAAEEGVDLLITGEAPHHAFLDAHELGVHLVVAGHYRTETQGVREVARRAAEELGLGWVFLDDPSGF